MSNRSHFHYRKEIDGLRAIAVILVILYHYNFTTFLNIFQNGFLGVDIFFVISGYLIASILMSEFAEDDSINLKNFYLKRAFRLLPNLTTVILASAILGYLLEVPISLVESTKSSVASLFFFSNYFFYFNSIEYGVQASQSFALLHTWSLSVEEQFYLFFPLILLLILRFFRRYLLLLISIIAAVSFLSIFFVSSDGSLTFYSSHSRIWELMCGVIVAHVQANTFLLQSFRKFFTISSFIAVISLGVLIFAPHLNFQHPGPVTAIAVVSVALMLLNLDKESSINQILCTKPLVYIGKLSYSLYLWHWPLLVYGSLYWEPLSDNQRFCILLSSLILSAGCYHYIEQPFRNAEYDKAKRIFCYLPIAGFSTVFLSFLYLTDGASYRVPETFQLDYKPWRITQSNGVICHNRTGDFCQSNASAETTVYFVGDSIVSSMLPHIGHKFDDINIVQMTSNACYFFPGFARFRDDGRKADKTCSREFQANIQEQIENNKGPKVLVLGGQIPDYIENPGYKNVNNEMLSEAVVYKQLKILHENTKIKIIYIAPTPQFWGLKKDREKMFLRGYVAMKEYSYSEPSANYDMFFSKQAVLIEKLKEAPWADVVMTKNIFCDDQLCYAAKDGVSLTTDVHHLAKFASTQILDIIWTKMDAFFLTARRQSISNNQPDDTDE